MSSRGQKLLARVNWYLQYSLKQTTEFITGNKSYYRGGRYRQVSLYTTGNNYGTALPEEHRLQLGTVFSC